MTDTSVAAIEQATMALSDNSCGKSEGNGAGLECERAEIIRRNQEMLSKLGVTKALAGVRRGPVSRPATEKTEGDQANGSAAERRPQRAKRARGEVEVQRRSTRLATSGADRPKDEAEQGVELDDSPKAAGRGVGILTQEEYLKSKGLPLPEGWFRSDGRFKGWVKTEVADRFNLASSAAEAWEQGGGGQFKRRISKSDVPSHLKVKGWSDARAFAASQLHKNPNAYFYRHTAPGLEQAQGEWTEEEHELFVKTAREHGVGDKWGLFASYIPNRVGYQCSAYYTQVIIPSGLILDSRYRMDAWGDAVFVGAKGQD